MEIVSIILSSVVLVGIIVLLIVMFTRKSGPSEESDRLVEKSVQVVMSKEMTNFVHELDKNSEKSSENLKKFELETQEYLSKRIEALNKQLDEKIAALDKKVDERLEKGFKGNSETMAQVRERLQAISQRLSPTLTESTHSSAPSEAISTVRAYSSYFGVSSTSTTLSLISMAVSWRL